jgi:hypothetical protein
MLSYFIDYRLKFCITVEIYQPTIAGRSPHLRVGLQAPTSAACPAYRQAPYRFGAGQAGDGEKDAVRVNSKGFNAFVLVS